MSDHDQAIRESFDSWDADQARLLARLSELETKLAESERRAQEAERDGDIDEELIRSLVFEKDALLRQLNDVGPLFIPDMRKLLGLPGSASLENIHDALVKLLAQVAVLQDAAKKVVDWNLASQEPEDNPVWLAQEWVMSPQLLLGLKRALQPSAAEGYVAVKKEEWEWLDRLAGYVPQFHAQYHKHPAFDECNAFACEFASRYLRNKSQRAVTSGEDAK